MKLLAVGYELIQTSFSPLAPYSNLIGPLRWLLALTQFNENNGFARESLHAHWNLYRALICDFF